MSYLNFNQTQEEARALEFKELVTKVVKYYSELCDAKNIKVVTELSPMQVTIPESRAELLVSNLLSNAIKYSMPESTITIRLQDKIFSIEDEGVGIAPQKLEEIFEMYKRDSTIAGGFGVGLNIVKNICDEYKIEVNVKSKLEIGSRFSLHF